MSTFTNSSAGLRTILRLNADSAVAPIWPVSDTSEVFACEIHVIARAIDARDPLQCVEVGATTGITVMKPPDSIP